MTTQYIFVQHTVIRRGPGELGGSTAGGNIGERAGRTGDCGGSGLRRGNRVFAMTGEGTLSGVDTDVERRYTDGRLGSGEMVGAGLGSLFLSSIQSVTTVVLTFRRLDHVCKSPKVGFLLAL